MNNKSVELKKGVLYWITGLSGAGKTTIGKALYQELKTNKNNIVFLDGDMLREIMGGRFGYSRQERMECAMSYARLAKLLTEQGLDVVFCTISMFNAVREWNRKNISNYLEIYIEVSLKELKKRDQKGLYSLVSDGEKIEVVGLNLEMELPENPDIRIDNNEKRPVKELVLMLQNEIRKIIQV